MVNRGVNRVFSGENTPEFREIHVFSLYSRAYIMSENLGWERLNANRKSINPKRTSQD